MASIQHLTNGHLITTAQSIATRGKEFKLPDDIISITCEANFVYSGGGTTAKVFIQTTFGNDDWFDVMCFQFTTASARKFLSINGNQSIASDYLACAVGTMSVDTAVEGIIGNKLRAQVVTTGTYTGTNTLDVRARLIHH